MEIKTMIEPWARMPDYAHRQDAGADLFSPVSVTVNRHSSVIIDTGVHMAIPDGYCGLLVSKSGLNVHNDITSTGLIDAGYTGSICVKLYNHGDIPYIVQKGDKISQIIIIPVKMCDFVPTDGLNDTERGNAGFGSSGR